MDSIQAKHLQDELASKMELLQTLGEQLKDPGCSSSTRSRYDSLASETKAQTAELKAWMDGSKDGAAGIRPEGESSYSRSGIVGTRSGPNGSYRSLFGAPPKSDWKSFSEFCTTLSSGGQGDARIVRSMSEGSPGDGGALVPTEYAAELLDLALQSEVVRPRCTTYAMTSNTKKIPGVVLGSHATSLFGGIVGGWITEGGAISETDAKYRSVELVAKKLAILSKASLEWADDAVPNSDQTVAKILAAAIGWYMDQACIRGSGSGQPLGVLNSPALVVQDAEAQQTTDTINTTNLVKMAARIAPGSLAKSVWVVSQTALAAILNLVVNFAGLQGAGASALFSMQPDGSFSLLTRPLLISEACSPIGDVGDVLLCDFSQYAVGLRGDLRLDSSAHVGFANAEVYYRAILRADGQPLWNEKLTLRDGTTTVSPFVTLAAR